MHSLKLNIKDSVFGKIIYFLQNLPKNEVEIVEDVIIEGDNKESIDFSKYKISAFTEIDDPVKWQKKIRNEWDR